MKLSVSVVRGRSGLYFNLYTGKPGGWELEHVSSNRATFAAAQAVIPELSTVWDQATQRFIEANPDSSADPDHPDPTSRSGSAYATLEFSDDLYPDLVDALLTPA
ncbi:MAG: hypothetical protein JWM37_112 [Candidatus Saccharibacteria bacterium]|nr:hypothetical protein [Candidatus Saccharibacteria bacterium]